MKKRIVAVLLSLTLSSAMLAEAGAAALPDVSAEALSSDTVTSDTVVDAGAGAEVGTDVNEGRDTDISAGTGTEDGTGSGGESGTIVDGGDLGDGTTDVPTDDSVVTPTPEAPVPSEDGTEAPVGDGEISGDTTADVPVTTTPEATATPTPEASNGLVVTPEPTPTVTPTPAVQVMSEAPVAASLHDGEKKEKPNVLNYVHWKEENGKWKLEKMEKLPETQVQAAKAAVAPQTAEVQAANEVSVTMDAPAENAVDF